MGRAPCCDKANVKRGPWSPEEDAILKSYLDAHGTGGNWIALPKKAGLKRCGKSCRLRWLNYLRPDIKHGCFTEEEDNIILNLYTQLGSRWSLIASQLPGRTDNDVKNHWNTKLKKKVLAAGKTSPEINNCNIIASTNDNNPSSAPPCSVPLVPKTETDSLIYSDSLAQSSVTWPDAIRHHVGYRPVVDESLNSDSRQFSFPGVTNMSEFVASSSASSIRIVSPSQDQESTSISADSSSLAVDNNGLSSVLPGNNSLEDVRTMMDSAGFGFSHDFIDGLDLFQERTSSGVASNYWYPNLADFDIYAEMQPPGLNQGVNNQQYY